MTALPPLRRQSVPKLLERIRSVWQQHEVPDWHQLLFEAKYGGGEYGPEILQRELQALQCGDALVQRVRAAIKFREEVLMRLTLLRTGYDDADFLTAGSLPRKHLFEQLEELRLSTFHCVEALSAWRRFLRRQVGTCIVWPYDGPTGEVDANSTAEQELPESAKSVLRSFEAVVELSTETLGGSGDMLATERLRDPFLLFKSTGGAGWKEPGRLCPPAAGSRKPRLQHARLQLMEDELSLSLRPKLPEQSVAQATNQDNILQKLMHRCKELGLERRPRWPSDAWAVRIWTSKLAPNLLALLKASSMDEPSDELGKVPEVPAVTDAPPAAPPAGAVMKLPITVKRWRPKTR
eukprot:s602_g4.t1